MLRLELLGTPRLVLGGETLTGLTSVKSQALLYYLAAYGGRAHSRLMLSGMLWPDKRDQDARMNLRQALRQLKQHVGDVLAVTRETIGLEEGAWQLDVRAFERQVVHGIANGDAESLARASALYSGEFLFGFYVDDAPDFETWMLLERERLRGQALQGLYLLAQHYLNADDLPRAMQTTGRLLALEPLHEESHRQMMRLLALDGRISAAMAQYETCRQILHADLGVAPATDTTRLYEEIRSGQLGPAQRAVEPRLPPRLRELPATATRPHNLPRQFTPLVGRQAELAQICDWIAQPSCALVTIRGPGGVGKTRLALEVAQECLADFRDGAWFVDLGQVAEPAHIYGAIGAALGLDAGRAGDARARVLEHLSDAELILILDNFEHLMAGVDELLGILQLARRCKCLVTSRESLHVHAEWLYELSGLPATASSSEVPHPSAAAQLFVSRLRQRRPDCVPTPAELTHIEKICRLVGGLPLAIELAASLALTQPPETIATAITRDMDVLATSMRDLPARHRNLRAVFEYSWGLLSGEEQRALAALSVFQSSFTTVAAAEVADARDAMLLGLLDKSMLRQPVSGRFELHEVVRQYAAQHREAIAEMTTFARRHSGYYLGFLSAREPALLGSEGHLAIDEIQRVLPDVTTAWRWAAEAASADAALVAQLEGALPPLTCFLDRCGLFHEGERLLAFTRESLAASTSADGKTPAPGARLLGRLLAEQGHFLVAQAEFDRAIVLAGDAVGRARQTEDGVGLARGYQVWGASLANRGQLREAQRLLLLGLDTALLAGETRHAASILSDLGAIHYRLGEQDQARRHFEQAQRTYEAAGDLSGEASVLNNLANIYARTGRYQAARQAYARAGEIYGELGDGGGLSLTHLNLAIVALHQRAYGHARELAQRALRVFEARRMRRLIAAAHNTLGVIALREGDLDAAEAWLGSARDLAQHIGHKVTYSEALANAGRALLASGHLGSAEAQATEALRLAEEVGEVTLIGYAASGLGQTLEAQAYWSGAQTAYQQAGTAWLEIGHSALVAEARAGLARAALGLDRLAAAQSLVDEILADLSLAATADMGQLDGTECPALVWETCARVLRLIDDPRAETLEAMRQRMASSQVAE